MADNLRAAGPEYVDVRSRVGGDEEAVLVPAPLSQVQPKPGRFEVGHLRRLVAWIGDGHVDVDYRLRGEAGRARRSDVLDSERPVAQGTADPRRQHLELGGPGWVGLNDLDGPWRRVGADPLDAFGIDVEVASDLLGGPHRWRA